MSSTEYMMVTKSAQSIFNRSMPRDLAVKQAEIVAREIAADFNSFVMAFGTDDPFDLAELVALEVVAA